MMEIISSADATLWTVRVPCHLTALDSYANWDRLFANDGSLDDLRAKVVAELDKLVSD
jgi:hypothetical protein